MTFAKVFCKIRHTFLHGSPDILARFTKESSAIGDERPYIDDGCTDTDEGCTDVGGGGTFLHEPCNLSSRTLQFTLLISSHWL